MLKKIRPEDLVCMDDYAETYAYCVELAYARSDNLLFGERIYREDAKLYLHKDLASIVMKAATSCFEHEHLHFVLYDGLRTSTAQERMMHTQRVRDNPHWLQEPRLLSPPGAGGHPRGMAIDIALETPQGELLDMGTAFDFLAANSHLNHNPAHRAFKGHSAAIMQNREILDKYMLEAAKELGIKLLPLPQEWWDYRLPPEVFNQYAPLADSDLPAHMRLIDV